MTKRLSPPAIASLSTARGPAPDPFALRMPNIRAAILPDPAFTLVEADLARADAQVCAWDADCPRLKRIFASGQDIHTSNACRIYNLPSPAAARDMHTNAKSYRDNAKQGVHLTDYAGGPRTLATSLAISEARAEDFIRYWLSEFPEISDWHNRILYQLRAGPPVVHNAFGFRKFYNDRITEYLLPQALAWICQSTVATAVDRAMMYAWTHFIRRNPDCKLSLQNHDSLLFQIRSEALDDYIPLIAMAFDSVAIPYPDPLVIPHEIKFSSLSWGDMKPWHATYPTSSALTAAK